MKKTISYLTPIVLVIGLALGLACSSGSKNDGKVVHSTVIRVKAQAGDKLNAYNLEEGDWLQPGSQVATSTFDASNSTAVLNIETGKSYRIRLERNGVEFLETAILSDQLQNVQDNTLNIGQISGLTTFFVIVAYVEARDNNTTVEARLKQDLADEGLSSMKDLLLSAVPNFRDFTSSDGNQLNMISITLARVAKALNTGASLDQNHIKLIIQMLRALLEDGDDVFASAFLSAHGQQILDMDANFSDFSAVLGKSRQAASSSINLQLGLLYQILMNTGNKKLPTLSASEIATIYVANEFHSAENFLNALQATSTSSISSLVNLFINRDVDVSSFELAHSTYGTRSGDNFTIYSLAPIFEIRLNKSLNTSVSSLLSVTISRGSTSKTTTDFFSLVRQINPNSHTIHLVVAKSNSLALGSSTELRPGTTYNYTITALSGTTFRFRGQRKETVSGTITTSPMTFTYPATLSSSDSQTDLSTSPFNGVGSTTPTFLFHSTDTVDPLSSLVQSGTTNSSVLTNLLMYLQVNLGSTRLDSTRASVTEATSDAKSFKFQISSSAGLSSGTDYTLNLSSDSQNSLTIGGNAFSTSGSSAQISGSHSFRVK